MVAEQIGGRAGAALLDAAQAAYVDGFGVALTVAAGVAAAGAAVAAIWLPASAPQAADVEPSSDTSAEEMALAA